MKAFLLSLLMTLAFVAPVMAKDYSAVSAFDDRVEYLDRSTVKTNGDIKTYWLNTVYIRTDHMGIDWTASHEAVDCKNARIITLNITGYRMNGDVVVSTQNYPSIQHYWTDVAPETAAAEEEDAVCNGHDLGPTSGASFSEVVPIARRILLRIAAKTPQAAGAVRPSSTPPASPPLTSILSTLGRALLVAGSRPPGDPASVEETEQSN